MRALCCRDTGRELAGEALSVVFNWERIVSLDCKILHCCIPPEQIKGSMRAAATLKREELFFHLISRDHENKGSLCPSSSEQCRQTDKVSADGADICMHVMSFG
jgi:hypothetical protein